jgi:DNA-binding MarR family transcriptional regulator
MSKQRSRPVNPRPRVERSALLEWVERVATYLAADGMPPIAGRILGWLMICDPAEQSAAEIAGAIGASRASLTTNLRVLAAMGFVSRRTRSGSRTAYYRVDEDAWEKVVRRQVASLSSLGGIVDAGLDLVGRGSARAGRIRGAHEIFLWMTRAFENAPPLPSGKRWSERTE